MRSASTALTLSFAAGLITAGSAQAMGFGRVANATQLGQRLNFAAVVRLEPDESLDRQCVSAEVMAGDNLLQPGQVRVTLEGGPDDPDRTVRVTTSTVIDEPVVSIGVTLGCNSRATRRFVVFIDPPGIEMAQSAPADPALLLPQSADSQVAPLLAIVAPQPPRQSAASRRESSTERRPPPQHAVGSDLSLAHAAARSHPAADAGSRRIASVRRAAPSRPVTAAARPPVVARLQLEAPALLAARTTVAASAAATAAETATPSVAAAAGELASASAATGPLPAAAQPSDLQAELLAREHQRIRSLEDDMGRLRAESAATRITLAGLQSRLRDSESERYSRPVVLALAGLCGLLALALAALWRRSSRLSKSAQWWTATGADRQTVTAGADGSTGEAVASGDPSRAALSPSAAHAGGRLTEVDLLLPGHPTAPPRGDPGPTASRAAAVNTAPMPLAPERSRESSVEELIDLEQQAEFFIVLGQDEAAIDLLTSHVRSEGGASPLPYLKLLDIHRRRSERSGYESVREMFNQRFNAYAPDWDKEPQQGRSLEEYPDVLDRLQRLWLTPSRAMAALDASVFRRAPADATFDLPAYRELLFLYSIARDLSEEDTNDGRGHGGILEVDLLLPLAESAGSVSAGNRPNTGAARRPEFQNSESHTLPVDLDVSFAGEPPPARSGPLPNPAGKAASGIAGGATAHCESVETVPSALRRPVGYPVESAFVDLELEPVGQADGVPAS